MINRLFLQFYLYDSEMDEYDLVNGFSDTWDYCKNLGDFIWISQDKIDAFYHRNIPEIKLPFSEGIVYASCQLYSQISSVINCAKENPDVEFVIGGPAVLFDKKLSFILSNVTIFRGSVEEYFNIENFSCLWNLEIPEELKGKTIRYCYTVDTRCYWGKCSYCNLEKRINRIRPKKNLKYKFGLNSGGREFVYLTDPSITPKLLNWISNVDFDNVLFECFARADKITKESFEKNSIDFYNLKLGVGIEYPSDRMLKIMNKGVSIKDIEDFFGFINNTNISYTLNFIVGWPQLIEHDVFELKNSLHFFRRHNIAFTNLLAVFADTELANAYPPPNKKMWFPIKESNKETKELNLKSLDIINEYFNVPKTYFRSCKNKLL